MPRDSEEKAWEEEQGPDALMSYRAIMTREIRQAEREIKRPAAGLIGSGLVAGFGIGVSVMAVAAVHTSAAEALPEMVLWLLAANAYTLGFILVILARTDLFTEYTTLAILPVLTGQATLRDLLKLWSVVYTTNLLGGALFALFLATIGTRLGTVEPTVFGGLAQDLIAVPFWVILMSGVLAGWLMGLLSWLVAAARDTISQIFFVWLVAFTIGLARLHHSIVGWVEMLAGYLTTTSIGLAEVLFFLGWTTLGNVIGGSIFALLIRYSLVVGATGGGGDSALRE